MSNDALIAAGEIAAVFEGLEVPYIIGGSVASTLWGEPRFTLDVDIVTALEVSHVAPFVAALEGAWYVQAKAVSEAIHRNSSFNIIRLQRMIKVDIFVPVNSGFHASKWKRARRECIDPDSSQEVNVTSPEDILLQKLNWYRKGNCVSENQWRDVTALLRIQRGHLDEDYLELWATNLDLSELLERARHDAI